MRGRAKSSYLSHASSYRENVASARRVAVTLFCNKPFCFSYVNDHVHGLVSVRIPRFVHEKQEGL